MELKAAETFETKVSLASLNLPPFHDILWVDKQMHSTQQLQQDDNKQHSLQLPQKVISLHEVGPPAVYVEAIHV